MTVQAELPHIEVFNRVLGLPMIELAIAKSLLTYSRVKDSHQLVNWVFSTAEASLTSATRQAVPIAAPIAKKFETPIQFFDNTLCRGLDKIEEKVPIVKATPNQVLENAYMLALDTVRPYVSTISHANDLLISRTAQLKDLGWTKANQILGTHYGTVAMNGLDTTAIIVDSLLDKYFPASGTEEDTEPTSIEEDKLLHTLQTVGRLSNKATRRVYYHVIENLKTINKDSLKPYVNSLADFLHCTQYVQKVNEQFYQVTSPLRIFVERASSA